MSKEHLPWEGVSGPIFTARDLKPRKRWVYIGGWVLVAVLFMGGLMTRYRVLLIFGVLYVLTLVLKKDTVVTTRGVEIYYQMRITTHYDFWSWDEIDAVISEDRKHPELVGLYFSRGDRVKRLFFPKAEVERIKVLAKEQNPRIKVGDADDPVAPGSSPKKRKK